VTGDGACACFTTSRLAQASVTLNAVRTAANRSLLYIIILYYAIYGSTQAHKHTNTKKAKIHLKYDLKYKKDINTNIKAHSSAR